MYTPYFAYSLDKTRRTGLLTPSLGYSSSEGIYYEQPIYIAQQNWWDLEFRPQYRSSRGYGIYQTFRFVDSASSHGEFKAGYFKEKSSYLLENNLQNNSHYGFNFLYDNNDVINKWLGLNLEGQSALYVDIGSMNDVDYINLETNDPKDTATATQVLSRINFFYNTDSNYFGTYFKYYQDLTLPSNSQTLQVLPALQYHYYLNTFFDDHFLYNLDVQANNITREEGTTVVQTDINLPLGFQTSLFDEYLNIGYKANAFMQHSSFGNSRSATTATMKYNDGYILRNYHTISASTKLTKGYEDLAHVVSFGVSYNRTGSESNSGYYDEYKDYCSDVAHTNEPICEYYNISSIQDEATLDLVQYLYDDTAKQILYHRLTQRITYSNELNRYGELENELDYKITSYLSYYNNMFYNYDERKFSKIFNEISVKKFGVHFLFSHLYKDNFRKEQEDILRYTSYLTSTLRYTYDSHYTFNAFYNYDIESQEVKSREIGFMYKQRCWDFGVRYSENTRPILTNNIDTSSEYDRYLYFTIILKPIMDSSDSSLLSYKFKKQ
jgi:LPS-assembly protein